MHLSFPVKPVCVCLGLLAGSISFPQAKPALPAVNVAAGIQAPESLLYGVEWRLIYAGSARISLNQYKPAGWESKLHLESGGLISKLYKLEDNYRVLWRDPFCATVSEFDAVEGKRHRDTKVTFDRQTHKATYLERDVLNNKVIRSAETEIPACVSDVIGALYKLRTLRLEPGQSTQLPISDGKKSVMARVDALDKEQVVTKAGKFNAIRYEAFVFNGILYQKNARLEIWLTDDNRKLPVQLRARMPFPIGTITFQLEKEGGV